MIDKRFDTVFNTVSRNLAELTAAPLSVARLLKLCATFDLFQILSQCSARLKMTQAARRLYTADGTMVLSVDDLIDWARDSYVKAEKTRLQREANGINATSETDKRGVC
jgi:hypothetical protein